MFELQTARLRLIALDLENFRMSLNDPRKVEENLGLESTNQVLDGPLREAVGQMLDGVAEDKENNLWHTLWRIVAKDKNRIVGGLDFKGPPDDNGEVQVGYGVQPAHRGKGYMAEALQEAVRWALSHPQVSAVLAETEGTNPASHRVLEKVGFVRRRDAGEMVWWRMGRDTEQTKRRQGGHEC